MSSPGWERRPPLAEAARPTTKTLRPVKEDSRDWDTTENLYIEGDNLEALKILQESYLGKVKMIYIDPPYNTGHDFIYRDKFQRSQEEEDEQAGVYDEDKNRLFENTESNGRFHSDWCSMMYSRLTLARNLLTDDGVIFISIDDHEANLLKAICDEVLGVANYRNQILVRRRTKSLNIQFAAEGLNSFNVGYEYIFVYSKSEKFLFSPVRQKKDSALREGHWNTFWSTADRPTMRYEILNFKPETGQWRWQKEMAYTAVKNYQEYLEKFASKMTIEEYWEFTGKKLRFISRNMDSTSKGGGVQYWIPPSDTVLRTSNWTDIEVSQIIKEFGLPFDNPKSTKLLKEIITSVPGENFCILDFFSGSATTAHAVMQLQRRGRRTPQIHHGTAAGAL